MIPSIDWPIQQLNVLLMSVGFDLISNFAVLFIEPAQQAQIGDPIITTKPIVCKQAVYGNPGMGPGSLLIIGMSLSA